MGKRVENSMDWMKDVDCINEIVIKRKSEHLVCYMDKEDNFKTVRIPAHLSRFLMQVQPYHFYKDK